MMSELELLTVLKNQLGDTIKYANSEFADKYEELLESYNQEPYGNEEDGHSQVISSDHYDMVESDMPSIARVFLGANKVMEFKPWNPQDAEEARQKTIYADYLVRKQPESFKVLHDWLKEPGFSKCSVVKYFCDEEEKPEYVYYENLNEDEMTVIVKDLENQKKVDRVEVESKDENKAEDGSKRYNVRFRVVRKTKKIRIVNVPPESFIMSHGASSKSSAIMIGDESTKTKGELIAEGFPKEMVKNLPCNNAKANQIDQKRFENQGGWDYKSGYHWTQEEVTVQNLYPQVDYDEDGIPERRFIMKVGDKILTNEPYGIAPYAIISQILMPHAAIGKSRGEQAARFQLEKTAIKRSMMDNTYAVTRPRHAVNDSDGAIDGGRVDLDDLASHAINGIVRCDGLPQECIMPLVVPFVGAEALQIIQYLDTEKSNTLGAQLANQGLTSDKFYKETATRYEGVEENAEAKIELVCRVYAETGIRDLYEGVIWTAQHYQDETAEIMVLGEPLTVDPRKWKYEHYCQSNVGLGAGDSADAIDNLGVMLQTQLGLAQAGSTLVDSKKIYNTLDDMIRAFGKPDVSRYFNDPEVPQQQLLAMLENQQKMLGQLQQMVQQNPLAEVENIKAQAKLIEAKSKQDTEAAKIVQNQQQFDATMALDLRKMVGELAAKMTELELKYQTNVPGSAV